MDHESVRPAARPAAEAPGSAPGPASGPAAGIPPASGRPRRRRRRVRWQTVARGAIVAGLAVFAALLVTGMRERRDPMAPRGVDRADPEALIESAGIELVRSDGGAETLRLVAERQLTYSDGSIRYLGVELTVPERADRDGFTMTGSEVFVDDDQSDFTVSGNVRMTAGDGLAAHTGNASYAEDLNLVTMHDPAGPTSLVRDGMEASGTDVTQDRERWIITIEGAARVRLTGDTDRAAVDVAAPRAILADADRYMYFEGGTRIGTGEMTMVSDTATAYFGAEQTALESIDLHGDVRIRSTTATDGGLRESRAEEITLRFDPATRQLQQVALTGQAAIELAGADGGDGSRIESAAMEVAMAPSRTEVVGLEAGGGVHVRLPVTPGDPRQEIRARAFTATGTPEAGLTGIRLDGEVEYDERTEASPNGAAVARTVRADRLEAGVGRGLVGLLDVRFDGGVRFEDETRHAEAASATYDLLGGTITLATDGDAGRMATLVDGNRTIAAATLEVALDGSRVSGSDGVQTVLSPPGDDPVEAEADVVPALLDRTERINILADAVDYDEAARVVTYRGQARMWQGNTSFEGETIAIDHASGGLSVTGSAQTTIQLVRIDEGAGSNVVSRTDAAAGSFVYDDATRHAVYEGSAVLRSDQGDLRAEKIEVFLQADGRTLERLAANDAVQLQLDGRWATGAALVYHEAEGRYDMEGAPVEIVEPVEPVEPDESDETEPSEPTCSTTRGRVLTFYRGSDLLAVDGREQSRTETSNGPCQPLQF